MPRRVAVLTTGRQDYGLLLSTLRALDADPEFELVVLAGGMHLRERFGRTVDLVRADGFRVARELDFVAEPPEAAGDAGRAVERVAAALRDLRPEALVLVGDRHETLAAGLAATLETVPVVHLHGGEETEGAVDNAMRHALTKLAHLHLVSTPLHARRVLQMGEDPATVAVVGAPGVDHLYRDDLPGREELAAALGMPLPDPVVLVTVHPATLGGAPLAEVEAVAAAMERVPAAYVVTQPNADTGGAAGRAGVALVDALGSRRYWGVLRIAAAVLGNSSSGIIEAPAAGVRVVDVGDRQRGRERGPLVENVPPDAARVEAALRGALAGTPLAAPGAEAAAYPAGPAAPRIVEALRAWRPPVPPRKAFRLVPA